VYTPLTYEMPYSPSVYTVSGLVTDAASVSAVRLLSLYSSNNDLIDATVSGSDGAYTLRSPSHDQCQLVVHAQDGVAGEVTSSHLVQT